MLLRLVAEGQDGRGQSAVELDEKRRYRAQSAGRGADYDAVVPGNRTTERGGLHRAWDGRTGETWEGQETHIYFQAEGRYRAHRT